MLHEATVPCAAKVFAGASEYFDANEAANSRHSQFKRGSTTWWATGSPVWAQPERDGLYS